MGVIKAVAGIAHWSDQQGKMRSDWRIREAEGVSSKIKMLILLNKLPLPHFWVIQERGQKTSSKA